MANLGADIGTSESVSQETHNSVRPHIPFCNKYVCFLLFYLELKNQDNKTWLLNTRLQKGSTMYY